MQVHATILVIFSDRSRRFDRGAWLTLLAGLGLMALNLALVLWAFAVPTNN